MANVQWEIKGPSFGTCNCAWGCPCQFNQPPTHGHCQAMDAMHIEEGHFGEVPLDGLRWANTYAWPGPISEGNGVYQAIIDERADDAQRAALSDIVYGRVSDEDSFFGVFASTMSTKHDPLFLPIEFECDIDKRRGLTVVPGIVEASGTPMTDPFSGDEQRVRLVLPEGFEFTETECASGNTKVTGDVKFDYEDCWAQFCIYHFNQDGIVR